MQKLTVLVIAHKDYEFQILHATARFLWEGRLQAI